MATIDSPGPRTRFLPGSPDITERRTLGKVTIRQGTAARSDREGLERLGAREKTSANRPLAISEHGGPKSENAPVVTIDTTLERENRGQESGTWGECQGPGQASEQGRDQARSSWITRPKSCSIYRPSAGRRLPGRVCARKLSRDRDEGVSAKWSVPCRSRNRPER